MSVLFVYTLIIPDFPGVVKYLAKFADNVGYAIIYFTTYKELPMRQLKVLNGQLYYEGSEFLTYKAKEG